MRVALSALVGLALFVVAVFLDRFVFESEPLLRGSGDLRRDFLPLYEVTYAWLAAGELPLWNPHHLTGIPLLGALQGGTFYPGHVLYLLLPTHIALAVSTALHLVGIALGLVWFGRTLGLTPAAALLPAIAVPLRGVAQWWVLWPNMLEASAWLPVGCVAVVRLARGERGAAPLLAGATGLAALAGHPQVGLFLALTWGTLLAALLAARPTSGVKPLPALARFAAALALGGAIGAIQLLPGLEMTREGTRTLGELPASQVQAMGRAFASPIQLVHGGQFSFGFVVFALAPLSLWNRRQRAVTVWALLLGATTGVLASAASESLLEVYRALPVIGWFRDPRRLLLVTQLCVGVLAAVGLDEALRRLPARQRGAGLRDARSFVAVGVLALAAIGAFAASSHRGRLPYDADSAAAYTRRDDFYRELAGRAGADRAVWVPYRPAHTPELKRAALTGLRWLDGYEPLNLARQAQYFTFLEYGTPETSNARRFFDGGILHHRRSPSRELETRLLTMAGRRRLLDLAAVRFYVSSRDVPRAQVAVVKRFAEAAGLREVESSDASLALFESSTVLPRAFVVYRARPAPETAALLAALARPDFDPLVASYVEGGAGFEASAEAPERGVPARITRDEPRVVEVEAQLDAPGLLVLADAYARGWTATVSGQPVAVRPVNFLFRGVALPAGQHRVRFAYRPASVPAGAALSLAGILAWVVIARRAGGVR